MKKLMIILLTLAILGCIETDNSVKQITKNEYANDFLSFTYDSNWKLEETTEKIYLRPVDSRQATITLNFMKSVPPGISSEDYMFQALDNLQEKGLEISSQESIIVAGIIASEIGGFINENEKQMEVRQTIIVKDQTATILTITTQDSTTISEYETIKDTLALI